MHGTVELRVHSRRVSAVQTVVAHLGVAQSNALFALLGVVAIGGNWCETAARMTAARSLQRKDIARVEAALLDALKAECPHYNEHVLLHAQFVPRPESKRAIALWEAYRLAWSAGARFRRLEQAKLARARGQGEAFFDDRRIDSAIADLERARTLVRNASRTILKDNERIEKEATRLGHGSDLEDHPEHARTAKRIGDALDLLVRKVKSFGGIPQARTQGEWDQFISSTAEKLLAVGFGSREVAGLLTGRSPDKVDRATLERFRQRVRRSQVSGA
jgi:hypothetical protein